MTSNRTGEFIEYCEKAQVVFSEVAELLGCPVELLVSRMRSGLSETELAGLKYAVDQITQKGERREKSMKVYDIKKSYVIWDYKRFKQLIGNRGVEPLRVKKIKDSINSVGYIPSRIIVNEKWEVIDGQCRLKVFQEYGLPAYVDMIEGAGIEECITMNINQSNWSIKDYVASYADQGMVPYKYLLILMQKHKALPVKSIFGAVTGLASGGSMNTIKTGKLKLSESEYHVADEKLDFLERLYPTLKTVSGNVHFLLYAVMFASQLKTIDPNRLEAKLKDKVGGIIPIATTEQAFKTVEDIYNLSLRGGKVYIYHEYQKYMEAMS